MVETVLLERLQIPELHATDVTRKQFVGRHATTPARLGTVMFGQYGTVAAARVPALLSAESAQVRLIVVDRQMRMLQSRVLLQQPHGRKVGHTDVTLGVGGRC
uniref:Uncharacterized protein n=1 Tax=Anopheles maculatus TaxID=74869 RepID=A0A182T8N0_9DIPT